MEGIGSEVSQKIRAAIKAKLIELGAYVDDELPDYIMVMVANKRTKSQMDEDLQLFLTSNTKIFTTWLHTVLQKLQEVTVASFELKKESDTKKSKKRKVEGDGEDKSRKSFEESVSKFKKHSKKHKDGKKSKKTKHKSKEKVKLKSNKIKKGEKEKGKSEKSIDDEDIQHDQNYEDDDYDDGKKSESLKEKLPKSKQISLNETVGKAILGNLKKVEKLQSNKNNSSVSTSSSEGLINLKKENQNENATDTKTSQQDKSAKDDVISSKNIEMESRGIIIGVKDKKEHQLIEDDFNIEPLEPSEKTSEKNFNNNINQKGEYKSTNSFTIEKEKTISVPTEELLKEHNKLLSEKSGEEKEEKSISEESMSPEELRKQLLLSRAKKKLENSKLAERMKSNSPDVVIIDEINKEIFSSESRFPSKEENNRNQWFSPSLNVRDKRYSQSPHSSDERKSCSNEKPAFRLNVADPKFKEKKFESDTSNKKTSLLKVKSSSSTDNCKNNETKVVSDRENRKNIIKISESLEMEKNMGVKKENDTKKEKEVIVRQRSILSRVVTITDPEAPEISSIIKVKPREFLAKDKQANKALILKAVADAEKSIATVPVRVEPEIEPKKTAIFTKNLREKRYEKLAVTLSNIRKSPDIRERLSRRISVDSEKSDRSRVKLDNSEMFDRLRGKSDWLSRKVSKSEDQFISSKTTVMEKNDNYIRCWLEGVEKAVKDDEIVNPSDMEDLNIHSNFLKEGTENEGVGDGASKEEFENIRIRQNQDESVAEKAQKKTKISEKDLSSLRILSTTKGSSDGGPQIVVTLDGLDSKTVKDIISRNKEAINGPILSEEKESEKKERFGKCNPRITGIRTSVTGANKLEGEPNKLSFQKISDRFGRLNKVHDDADSVEKLGGEPMKKSSKYSKVENALNVETSKNSTKSKNRELIAQLSEKFGKVDRKFENKKRKHPEEERRYQYESRKNEREDSEYNGKYKRSERKGHREGQSSSPSKFTSSSSALICKYAANCKNIDCRYYHPKKCRFYDDCSTPDCKYIHSESSSSRKSRWYSKS